MKKEFIEMPKTLFISDLVIPFLKKDNLIDFILKDENFIFLKNYIGKLAILNEEQKNDIAIKTKESLKKTLFK